MYNDFCLKKYADMAQAVEHVLGKDEVTGSNPVISSKKAGFAPAFFFFPRAEYLFSGFWAFYGLIHCVQKYRKYLGYFSTLFILPEKMYNLFV